MEIPEKATVRDIVPKATKKKKSSTQLNKKNKKRSSK